MKILLDDGMVAVTIDEFGRKKGAQRNKMSMRKRAEALGVHYAGLAAQAKFPPIDWYRGGKKVFVVLDKLYGEPLGRLNIQFQPLNRARLIERSRLYDLGSGFE